MFDAFCICFVIDDFHHALLLHPQGADNDVVDNAVDIVPRIGFVLPLWKAERTDSLRPKFNAFAPKFDPWIDGAMEDEAIAFGSCGMPRRNRGVMPNLFADNPEVFFDQLVGFSCNKLNM